ncbi:sugar phosphate nucleotidyltransferase [Endozoicomonas sp. ALD040]
MNLIPVIMSGGSGSRLWPQSRSIYPKQFGVPATGKRTNHVAEHTCPA